MLLADGDEALLALKLAEGVNAAIRGLWRLASFVPLRVFPVQRRLANDWRVALPVYGLAAVGVLIWLLRSDVSVMSLGLVLKAILAALLLPGFFLLAWSLLLALPALLITPFGFLALGLLRWVAFGWAGSFDLEMTAETCPVGTATIARLGPRLGPRGLRHGYSYNDRRAPVHIARFIRRGLGETGRPATVPARAAAGSGLTFPTGTRMPPSGTRRRGRQRNLSRGFGGLVMTRTVGFVCCASLLAFASMLASAGQTPAPESTPIARTAIIEAIDKANRTVTLKGSAGNSFPVRAPEGMEGFDSLKVGDQVTVTYFTAVAVSLRKPGASPPAQVPPTTITRRTDRTPGSETRREQTFSGKVDAIDVKALSLSVREPHGRVVPLTVSDAAQLQNLRTGDTVDVVYYESLLIKVERPQK